MSRRDNLVGAAWLAGAMTLFNTGDAFMKLLSEQLPIFQAIALRNWLTAAALGLAWALRRDLIEAGRLLDRKVLARAVLDAGFALVYLWGVSLLPLADAVALLFVSPLIGTLLAAAVLRERVGPARWLALAIGFVGVLLIVRPGFGDWQPAALLPLLAAGFMAGADVVTRRIGSSVGPPTVIFTNLIVVAVLATGLALAGWTTVTPAAAVPVVGAAVFLLAGYLTSVVAFARGEVSFVSPFKYAGLPAALLLGWLVWGHWPTPLALAGAALIVAAGLLLLVAERRGAG
ncbi:MAG: DMT family transporter [Geminicoccaceae bacterium]